MALPSPTRYSTGFFPGAHVESAYQSKPPKKSVFVNVGGNGDCGFRSVAAGLIDNFLNHPRANADLLAKVLNEHLNFFPEHKPTLPGLVTASERLKHMIRHVGMGEFLQSLAYTLRQMAVTEMCKHPELYRGAFVDNNEGTKPADMRKANTWINESSIAALSNVLALPIEVQVVTRQKTLPMCLHYNASETGNSPVVMQLQGGHYIPRVTSTELFKPVSSQPVRVIAPATETLAEDRSLAEIHAAIAIEDKRLVDAFEDAHHRLSTMVVAGELSKNDLLKMYVKGMATSDYLAGRVAYVGVEHGNQDFFDAIISTQRGVAQEDLPTGDQHIMAELVHALARAITIGQMNADDIFAHMEDSLDTGSSRYSA
jgi:hypothetical protein